MGRQSRAKALRREQSSSAGLAMPSAILHGAELVIAEANKKGDMQISLPNYGYNKLDSFNNFDHVMEIGSVGTAKPMASERVRHIFQFASSFAASEMLESQSFDPKSEQFKQITIKAREHGVDGHLLYMPRGMAKYTTETSSFNQASFTTGVPILSGDEPSISFVTADSTISPTERAMSTATEITQNRFIVEGVIFEGNKVHTELSSVNAFQESIANGLGNALGAVALGWTYGKYQDYLAMYERRSKLWSGTIKGFLGKSTEFIAPHLMLGEDTYDQLFNNEIPAVPEIIPRQPLKL